MNRKQEAGFTLVELIVVIGILAILLCVAAPNMMNYIQASRRAAAQNEAEICADAAQRYLDDQRAGGKLTVPQVKGLIGLELRDRDGLLADYMTGGQKDAKITFVGVDMSTGRLKSMTYENRYCKVDIEMDEEGVRTLEVSKVKERLSNGHNLE